MPFIAIAVFVSVLLGGGAYASQTENGDAYINIDVDGSLKVR